MKWKPSMWMLIKGDYGHEETEVLSENEEDDDYLLRSVFTNETPVTVPTPATSVVKDDDGAAPSSSKSGDWYVSNRHLKETIIAMQENIMKSLGKENIPLKDEKYQTAFNKMKDCLKCLICLEVCDTNSVSFCPDCGRMIGCFTCVVNLQKCPVCREDFSAELRGYKIPGLADILSDNNGESAATTTEQID